MTRVIRRRPWPANISIREDDTRPLAPAHPERIRSSPDRWVHMEPTSRSMRLFGSSVANDPLPSSAAAYLRRYLDRRPDIDPTVTEILKLLAEMLDRARSQWTPEIPGKPFQQVALFAGFVTDFETYYMQLRTHYPDVQARSLAFLYAIARVLPEIMRTIPSRGWALLWQLGVLAMQATFVLMGWQRDLTGLGGISGVLSSDVWNALMAIPGFAKNVVIDFMQFYIQMLITMVQRKDPRLLDDLFIQAYQGQHGPFVRWLVRGFEQIVGPGTYAAKIQQHEEAARFWTDVYRYLTILPRPDRLLARLREAHPTDVLPHGTISSYFLKSVLIPIRYHVQQNLNRLQGLDADFLATHWSIRQTRTTIHNLQSRKSAVEQQLRDIRVRMDMLLRQRIVRENATTWRDARDSSAYRELVTEREKLLRRKHTLQTEIEQTDRTYRMLRFRLDMLYRNRMTVWTTLVQWMEVARQMDSAFQVALPQLNDRARTFMTEWQADMRRLATHRVIAPSAWMTMRIQPDRLLSETDLYVPLEVALLSDPSARGDT